MVERTVVPLLLHKHNVFILKLVPKIFKKHLGYKNTPDLSVEHSWHGTHWRRKL